MYAVAANCLELEVLTLGGYNEHVTDGGITVLLEACRKLHTVKLSSKLLKVGRGGVCLLVLLVEPAHCGMLPVRLLAGGLVPLLLVLTAALGLSSCLLPCAGD
jgi:hypothetical protein